MRTTLLILSSLFTSMIMKAQSKDFDLSGYQFPDYKRSELNFDFSSFGASIFKTAKDDYYHNLNSSIDVAYLYDFYTRKKETYAAFNIESGIDYTSMKDGGSRRIYNDPEISIRASLSERFYITKNKFFLTYSPEIYYSSYSRTNKYNGETTSMHKNDYFSASVSLGGGLGRIEKVSDLWQSYYILEKLHSKHSLIREPEKNDIYEFATLSSKLKNKRFFDNRLRKIAELHALDSLLRQQGLIDDANIEYFTTLNDYWSFANVKDRYSGNVLNIGFRPQYSNSYQKHYVDSAGISSDVFILYSSIDFSNAKQINLYWERRISLSGRCETNLDEGNNTTAPDNYFGIQGSIGWNYYPNFRTSVGFTVSYLGTEAERSSLDTASKFWYDRTQVEGSFYYYLSPQIRIYGELNLEYMDTDYGAFTSNNQIRVNYNLGILYSIF